MLCDGQKFLHHWTAANAVEYSSHGLLLTHFSSPHLVVHGAILHQHIVREVHQPPHASLAHHRPSDDILPRPGDQLLQTPRIHHTTVPQRTLHCE